MKTLFDAFWEWYYHWNGETGCEVGPHSIWVGCVVFVIAICTYAYVGDPDEEEWVFGAVLCAIGSAIVGVGLPVLLAALPFIGFFFFFLPWLKEKGNNDRRVAAAKVREKEKARREAEKLLNE